MKTGNHVNAFNTALSGPDNLVIPDKPADRVRVEILNLDWPGGSYGCH